MTYNISEPVQSESVTAAQPPETGTELGGGIPPLQPVTYNVAEPVLPILPSLNSVLVQSLVHTVSAPVHQVKIPSDEGERYTKRETGRETH